MNEWERHKREKALIIENNAKAFEWMRRNYGIVKRELGNSWTGQDLIALWKSQTVSPPPVRALSDKIHWKADQDTLRAHLAGLRNAGYITFDDIEAVLDGTKKPRTVGYKRGTNKSEARNIVYIFFIWDQAGFIDEFTTQDGSFQHEAFIIPAFDRSDGSFTAQNLSDKKTIVFENGKFTPKDPDLHAALSDILR